MKYFVSKSNMLNLVNMWIMVLNNIERYIYKLSALFLNIICLLIRKNNKFLTNFYSSDFF